MRPGKTPWVLGRMTLAAFCWATTAYGLVTASPFAYAALIKPRVLPSVAAFSDWNVPALWIWCALLLLTLLADVQHRQTRVAAGTLLAASVAATLFNTFQPVLPRLRPGAASLAFAAVALVPVLWLACIDHLRARGFVTRQRLPPTEEVLGSAEGRWLVAWIATAVFVTALYGVIASMNLAGSFEPDLSPVALAGALASSLLLHLCIASVGFLVAAIVLRLVRRSFALQHAALLLVLTVALWLVLDRLVARAIGLDGVAASMAAAGTAASLAATWSGLRLSRLDARGRSLTTALDVFFGPSRDALTPAAAVPAALVALLAFLLVTLAGRIDWDGLLLDAGVIVVWLSALGAVARMVAERPRLRGRVIACACLIPLVAYVAAGDALAARHTLDRYAVYNPSLRVGEVLRAHRTVPSFDRFLRDNTGFNDTAIAPIDIDFTAPLAASPAFRPDIFLFAIDSLRPDYLGPYNPDVHFTPAIDWFAKESLVFTNVFTRYGGTDMSVPAIWAGSAIIHKQFVAPFHPMNALEKLLGANGYQRVLSPDSVVDEILQKAPTDVRLNGGHAAMDYGFCDVLRDLAVELPRLAARGPVFAYALPQDIHLSRVGGGPSDGTAGSLYAPSAEGIRKMDACFGRFIETLKQTGEYDRSLIILTADHGDMLGENRMFGHSYYLFPPVVQIPLIVRLPAALAGNAPMDLDAVRLSTDITPTLYQALGYRAVRANAMMGRPVIGEDAQSLVDRRREATVLAASYGAVYATLDRNGRRLYIADAVNQTDYEYERSAGAAWKANDVSPALRETSQFAIRQHLDTLARMYHLTPVQAR